ncbi:MAG: glpD2 [Acidobacteria bacterium]|nr:glpD2 [Acidobacteriota bacterium]
MYGNQLRWLPFSDFASRGVVPASGRRERLVPEQRAACRETIAESVFDVAVLGGGINGASVYAELCRRGYRVLLLDRGDFAGGSSQSTAMWIWGGLLYLSALDFPTVVNLCANRDRLIKELPGWVRPEPNRYVATRSRSKKTWLINPALWLYWGLSAFRRRAPLRQSDFPERHLFRDGHVVGTSLYEEGSVFPSDTRFVVRWILPWCSPERPALNYCEVVGGCRDNAKGFWRLELRDRVSGKEMVARARWVVNAAWGPVALWGPTDTVSRDPESGFFADAGDIRTLLDELNRHTVRKSGPEDIIALRCGVRPLAVKRSYNSNGNTLGISRRHIIARDPHRTWISLYGGKLTSCMSLATEVGDMLEPVIAPGHPDPALLRREPSQDATEWFPGLEQPVLSVNSAVEAECCCTLEDYLRRRTNIAQWVPRHGLGRTGEHIRLLAGMAEHFPGVDGVRGAASLAAYQSRIEREFDQVLREV